MKNNPSPEKGLWAFRNTQKVGSKIWEGEAKPEGQFWRQNPKGKTDPDRLI